MKTTIRIFLALALPVLTAAAYADPPARVARLNHISGTVSFAPAEAPGEWSPALVNRPLIGGDRLWTDHGARAELHVGATAVRLAPLTSLDILQLDDERLQLRLAQGSTNVRVRGLDQNDVVELVTPAGTLVLRPPGSFRVSADPHTQAVRTTAHSGEAEVLTAARSFIVPAGQTATFVDGGEPLFEVAAYAHADEFDRWSAERDRRQDAVVSTRYVSPDMTGYEDLDAHGSWRTVPEYGAVWIPARVAPDWAPFRHGHWTWISPWGWTWIDDAPWGFAPSHYGRWVRVHDHWAWAPGPIVRRPVYAPAMVAFVGGSNWSVSLHNGPAVGWFPLGWREPYRPWYRASHAHVHRVNVMHVTNIYNTEVRHVHRGRPDAVTVVRRQDFVSARPVSRSRFRVAHADLAHAEVLRERPPAERVRGSRSRERRADHPISRPAARASMAPRRTDTPRRDVERREDRAEPRIERAVPPANLQRRARAEAQREDIGRQHERTARPRAGFEPGRGGTQAQPRERVQRRARVEAHSARPQPPARVRAPGERRQTRREGAPQRDRMQPRAERQRWTRRSAGDHTERRFSQTVRGVPQAARRAAPAASPAAPVAAPVRPASARAIAPARRAQQHRTDTRRRSERPQRRTPPRNSGAPRS